MSSLKVDAALLTAKAKQVQDSIKNIHTAYVSTRNIVNKCPKYWQGDASDKHTAMFDDIEEKYANAYKELCGAPDDMNTIAGNYMELEKSIAEELFSLPSDIIH